MSTPTIPTMYTFAQITEGLKNGSILLTSGTMANITRYAYYEPYINYTNYPFPILYMNITNGACDISNYDSNNTYFIYTDFITATDWIVLNGA